MTDAERDATLDVARRLFAAVAAGDLEAVRSLYAPEVVIWHNNDGASQSADQNLAVLSWVTQNIAGLRYEDVRLQATETGFIEQHVMRGRTPGGAELTVPACLVATVTGGRIIRLDEYLDSAHLAPLLA